MTRKDYVALARALRTATLAARSPIIRTSTARRACIDASNGKHAQSVADIAAHAEAEATEAGVWLAVRAVSEVLARDNALYDEARFFAAVREGA